jgi:hypothetical protein
MPAQVDSTATLQQLHDAFVTSATRTGPVTKPRAFVLLFGLLRSTIPLLTLRSNVIAPLKSAGLEVSVLMHTFTACQRSSDLHPQFASTAHSALQALRQLVPDVQVSHTPVCDAAADLEGVMEACKASGDAWRDRFTAYSRHMMQLHSLANVTHTLAATFPAQPPDALILHVRPDTLPNCPLLVPDILAALEADAQRILLPFVGELRSERPPRGGTARRARYGPAPAFHCGALRHSRCTQNGVVAAFARVKAAAGAAPRLSGAPPPARDRFARTHALAASQAHKRACCWRRVKHSAVCFDRVSLLAGFVRGSAV